MDGSAAFDPYGFYKTYIDHARILLETTQDGGRVVRALSDGMDDLLVQLLSAHPHLFKTLTLVALGGYGRQTLAPFSDIDLMILADDDCDRDGLIAAFDRILLPLWDLGLQVGYSIRTVDDCLEESSADHVVLTSLLDARFVVGTEHLFHQLQSRLSDMLRLLDIRRYIADKMSEREIRIQRFGRSRQMREPHLKSGKGALRDVHLVGWLGRVGLEAPHLKGLVSAGVIDAKELKRFRQARDFLHTVRCHLHFLTGRAEDQLLFDEQKDIAQRFGFSSQRGLRDVERFMKLIFHATSEISTLFNQVCAALEMRGLKDPPLLNRRASGLRLRAVPSEDCSRFVLRGGRLHFQSDAAEQIHLPDLFRLFVVSDFMNATLHPSALTTLERVKKFSIPDDAGIMRACLINFQALIMQSHDPEIVLSQLNDTGLIARVIPQFRRVRGLIPFNSYHELSVDMHLLATLGVVADFQQGRSELFERSQVLQRAACDFGHYPQLRLAAFLHDIGKGRERDHRLLGAEIAQKVCQSFELCEEDAQLIRWLVRHHHLMSTSAFERDMSDPRTLYDFARQVGNFERLHGLYLLSVADIYCVGSGVLTSWKLALLDELFLKTRQIFEDGFRILTSQRTLEKRQILFASSLQRSGFDSALVAAFLNAMPDTYLMRADDELVPTHAKAFLEAREHPQKTAVICHFSSEARLIFCVVVAPDRPQMLKTITRALSAIGFPVLDGIIHSAQDGFVLDTFTLHAKSLSLEDDFVRAAQRCQNIVYEALVSGSQKSPLRHRSPARFRAVFHFTPRVMITNTLSDHFTLIEIRCPDYSGLLSDIAAKLARLEISVFSAHVRTYGAEAVDVFYVLKLNGERLSDIDDIPRVRRALQRYLKARFS